MVAKSAEAFRTISEAAKELDVPQHVLRHWEEVFGQVRPMRRAGGRRYYRPLDIDLLRGIRVLLYDQRYTTKGVQKIFKDEGIKYISELGRRAAAGESVEIRPVLDDDDKNEGDDILVLGEDAVVEDAISPKTQRVLKEILTRLQRAEAALDEAGLALEAVTSLDTD